MPDRRRSCLAAAVAAGAVVAAFSAMQLGQRIGCFFACQVTLSKHNSKAAPQDIPVDELVTWRGLAGDGRLAQALEQCEENGWEAVPLAAKELTRLYPDLWRTRKAAEDWARKNPLNPYNSTIRVWGVLNTYRPPRQTRWSKALVRHGADPRTALAAVLGVPAEAVRVRGQRAWASLR